MESYGARDEVLLAELARGQELARKLERDVPMELRMLARSVVDSWEKAMVLARQRSLANMTTVVTLPHSAAAATDVGPRHATPGLGDVSRKRKMIANKWTKQVRVSSSELLEGAALEDGHSWRKYGQKDILGAAYPRGYYRCTHKDTQGCSATKQVQRSNNDPTIVHVTYCGDHTCVQQQQLQSQLHTPSRWCHVPDVMVEVENPNPSAVPGIGGSPPFDFIHHQIMATNAPSCSGASLESNQAYLSPCDLGRLGGATQSQPSEMVPASTAISPFLDLAFGPEDFGFDGSILDGSSFLPHVPSFSRS